MSIGSRIKEAREKKGLKQRELATMVGVSYGAIGNYETDVSSPKMEILYKIMRALDVDANYLYQDEMPELKQKEKKLVTFSGDELTERQRLTMEKIMNLDSDQQQAILDLLDTMLRQREQ